MDMITMLMYTLITTRMKTAAEMHDASRELRYTGWD